MARAIVRWGYLCNLEAMVTCISAIAWSPSLQLGSTEVHGTAQSGFAMVRRVSLTKED